MRLLIESKGPETEAIEAPIDSLDDQTWRPCGSMIPRRQIVLL